MTDDEQSYVPFVFIISFVGMPHAIVDVRGV